MSLLFYERGERSAKDLPCEDLAFPLMNEVAQVTVIEADPCGGIDDCYITERRESGLL